MEIDYLNKLRPTFPNKTEAELELFLASSRELQKYTGVDAAEHRKRGMKRLFPSRIWHEWRDQRMRSVQYCLENRIQELGWIGSSNSNKSADMADIALALWWTKPEMTSIYVASPYETATELGVWAYIVEQFNEAKQHNHGLPGRLKTSDNSIVLYERNPRAFIRVATVDQVGKLVGKKARDFSQGLMVLLLDELPAFTASASRSLMGVLPNLISVPNLLIIHAGNFANPWDALGTMCDPDEKDIPGGYEGFDPDRHFTWRTKRGGIVHRFDGLQSPNVKAGKDIYPFLTTIEYIGKLANGPGGLNSPEAMRFIRSAPITSLDEFTITNMERIRAGGALEPFEWTSDPIEMGAYVDPGFGTDPCVLQKFKLGWQKVADGRKQIVALWEEPVYIPVRVGLLEAGKVIPVERQIVRGVRAHCEKHRISTRNVGFDGSMRSAIVQEFAKWSLEIRAIDSQGPATSRPANVTERRATKPGEEPKRAVWKDKVDRLLSEFWFAAASLMDSGQLKGLALSPKAMRQMTTRRWAWQGKEKKKVQTKQEYKDDLKKMGQVGESPNEADSVVGCVEMARELGLAMDAISPQGGSLEMILGLIREREAVRSFRSLTQRSGLLSGTLHATKQKTGVSSGKLHRR